MIDDRITGRSLDRYRLLRMTDSKFVLQVGNGRRVGRLGEYVSPEQAMRHLAWFTGRDDIPETCDSVDYRAAETMPYLSISASGVGPIPEIPTTGET